MDKIIIIQLFRLEVIELVNAVSTSEEYQELIDVINVALMLAARLEGLATPGGICISGSVYDQVHNKLTLSVVDLGMTSVKNISDPIQTYRILVGEEDASQSAIASLGRKFRPFLAAHRVSLAAFGVILFGLVAAIAIWGPGRSVRQLTAAAHPVRRAG